VLSLTDLDAVSQVAARVDPNPLRVGGRLLGLSGDEQRAGVPMWGYVTLALGVGFLGGVFASRTDFLRSRLGGE
jgi:hypothetical protein